LKTRIHAPKIGGLATAVRPFMWWSGVQNEWQGWLQRVNVHVSLMFNSVIYSS